MVEYYNHLAARDTEREQGRELRIDDRVRMARNLALGFRAVHAAGYVIGDVNEKNVEVNRQNDIAMVDCDSYGFKDQRSSRAFSNNMGRPEFQAPETQDDYANRTQEQDLFGLAVLIFHLLTGFHPYHVTNQPDHNLPSDRIKAWLFPPARRGVTTTAEYMQRWNGLHQGQKDLFLRCFDPENQGQARPTPEQWVTALAYAPEDWTETLRASRSAPTTAPPTPQQTQQPRQPQPTTQQTRPPRQQRQRPTRQQTRPPRQQRQPNRQRRPSPQQTQPSQPPQQQRRPSPVSSAGSGIGKRTRLVAGVIGVFVLLPILIWLFRGNGNDHTFTSAASVAAGAGSVPAAVAPAPTSAPIPTNPAAPTPTPIAIVVTAPARPLIPTNTPAPTAQPPTHTPAPTATLPPTPTLTLVEWLYPNATHSIVDELAREKEVHLQGCYLGNQTSTRKFRLASWDTWDPSLYGDRLKFVKIITNNGARIPLEQGTCYEANVTKHVDSPEEYVCLDRDAAYPQQYPCNSFREHEVIPTFILYPNTRDDPDDFTDNFVRIHARP